MTDHTSKDFDEAIERGAAWSRRWARASSASSCLDILFVAKSLERIGDHAKNVAEHAVYAAMGEDVRHATAQEIDELLRS